MHPCAIFLSVVLLGSATVEPVPEDLKPNVRPAPPAALDAKPAGEGIGADADYTGRPLDAVRPDDRPADKASQREDKTGQSEAKSVLVPGGGEGDARGKGTPAVPLRPLVLPRQRETGGAAGSAVVEAMLSPAEGSELRGRPLSLAEAIGRAGGDRVSQTRVTHAYWRLAAATANYYESLRDRQRAASVGSLAPGSAADDTAAHRATLAAADARAADALAEAAVAQGEVAALLRIVREEDLPLVVDAPHAGTYSTRFDEIFAMRPADGRSWTLDRTLPLRHKSVGLRTAAFLAAREAVESGTSAYAQRTATIDQVASRIDRLRNQRRAFLAAVLAYNADIADYALGVASLDSSETALVAMLIRSPAGPTAAPAASHTSGSSPSVPSTQQPAIPARNEGWTTPR